MPARTAVIFLASFKIKYMDEGDDLPGWVVFFGGPERVLCQATRTIRASTPTPGRFLVAGTGTS